MSSITGKISQVGVLGLLLTALFTFDRCANFDAAGSGAGFVLLQGGGGNGGGGSAAEYSIFVQVTGLTGASTNLVLQNNGADDLSLSTDGSHAFSLTQAANTGYNVSILTQPTGAANLCTVSGGNGTVVNGDVTSITINCTSGFTVGGVVSGLVGSGLVLQNNAGDDLSITSNGFVSFATPVANGATYAVTVLTQPTSPSQTCTVTGGTGTIAGANVTTANVNCVTNSFTIGVTTAGLAGTGLVLQNNAGDNLSVTANGSATFATSIASGSTYNVTVLTQPSSPTQTCTVSGGSGTVAAGNVTSVAVNCSTSTFTVGGTASGLAGTGLVLQNNAGDNLSVTANGSFSFATPVASGSTYAVTVLTQPSSPTQTCTVGSGTGTVTTANVTAVTVTCVTNTYTIGGTASGLAGTGLVLQNNAGDNLAVTANGSFTFATSIASGSTYSVTVLTQPSSPTQTCTVSGASGTVVSSNVTSVTVNCTTNTYTVGGTLAGLAGTGLVLQNNAGDNLSVTANGSFAFATAVASGAAYNVTVLTQPSTPSQTCTVGTGTGTVGAANVTSVTVNCTTAYSVGGTLSGLAGTGLVLQNNAGDNLSVTANGSFTFSSLLANAATYAVTILTQPTGPAQTCSLGNAAGTIAAANVTNVTVTCITGNFTGGTIQTPPTFTATPQLTTLAGDGTGASSDGTGTGAQFSRPESITTDGTNLYVIDRTSDSLRKIVIATGVTTTITTTPASPFTNPYGITTDGTNLYVTDLTADLIYKVVIATGVTTTLAGGNSGGGTTCTGTNTGNCKDGTGTQAQFDLPVDITSDANNLYVADGFNDRIRKIVISTGVVTTLAGSGSTADFDFPKGMTTDGTYVYVVDTNNSRIRRVTIADGTTTTILTGVNSIRGITTDGTNLYLSSDDDVIFMYDSITTGGTNSTIAGSTSGFANGDALTVGQMDNPNGITNDGDALYISDSTNNRIRKYK